VGWVVGMTDTLTAALRLAERGWPCFPCQPGGKAPLTAHGFKDASTNTDIITGWWRRWPVANLAIPTGRSTVDVLDVDNHGEAGNGWKAFNRAKAAGLLAGATAMIKTPSAGLHVYFQPSGVTNHSLARHHLDTRGDGGYVLVPPSVVNDKPYEMLEWRAGGTGVLRWAEIVALLDPPRPVNISRKLCSANRLDHLVAWLATRTEGSRNSSLFWCCCTALENGITNLAPLIEAAISIGLTDREATATARSAERRLGAA
jgi:hypothetical protein